MKLRAALAFALTLALAMGARAGVAAAADAPSGASERVLAENDAPLSGAIDPAQYHVGPGDVFTVWIWGPVARTSAVTIGPEGDLFLPEIGPVAVAGLTLQAAREAVIARVRAQLRGVTVEVRLAKVRSFRVYVTGEVVHSGPVIATGGTRVFDVLPDTLLLSGASRRNIVVESRDGQRAIVDLERVRLSGDQSHDAWLRDGDVIRVPAARTSIGVWGAVGHPSELEGGPDDDLATVLHLAGDVRPEARADSALLVRFRTSTERESTWFAIADVESKRYSPAITDGDQVYVFGKSDYHTVEQVAVQGRVGRVGVYPIRAGVTRLSDVLSAAGGLLPDADRSSIELIRLRPEQRPDPEFDRLARLSREEMTATEYESFRTRLAALNPDFRVDWLDAHQSTPRQDPLLQKDDVIRVERVSNALRVDGQVRRPGLISLKPGADWRYYIEQAGGFTRRGAHTQVRVTRAASGQTLLARDVEQLAPGDFLWVPERPDFSFWGFTKDILVVSAQLATVIVALRR